MKKHLLILIFALPMFIGQGLKGQQTEFAPVGAKWYYTYNNLTSYGYITIESIGDTLIQTKNCKILQKTSYGYTWPGYLDTISLGSEYVYNDSNAVYFFRKNEFYTLFEFGPINTSWDVVGNSFFNNIDSGTVYIDSVGVELIDGIPRNVVFVKSTPQSCIGWANAKIIEGIGVVNDYFFPDYIDCVFDANEGGAFRCYYFEDNLIYSTTNANYCDFIQNIANFENAKIEIFPNPCTDFLNIQIQSFYDNDVSFNLFNINGQLVKSELLQNNGTGKFSLNVSNLPKGLYLLNIQSNTKQFNKKVIIQ